jgi:hypothetical protein
MKRVCAWCGRDLDPSERHSGTQVTHGLCHGCRSRFFALAKQRAPPPTPEVPRPDPEKGEGPMPTE